MKNEKGQTLVIIVLVMVMALAIGITTSNRFIKTLRSTTRTQTSYRSSAVAEALLERLLTKSTEELEDYITYSNCGSECTLQITNTDGVVETATATLSRLGESSDPFQLKLTEDQSNEINLEGYPDTTDVTVCWNNISATPPPAVVGILVHGTDGNYEASSFAYNSSGSLESNNFDEAFAANGYDSCFDVDSQSDPQVIRLRALYQDIDVMVYPAASTVIPNQGVLIESVGITLDTETKVSAVKGKSKVPFFFDYVIYSKSDTNPLAN